MLTGEETKALRLIRLAIAPAKWFRIDKDSLPQWLERNADGTRLIDLIHRLICKGWLRQDGVRIYLV